jgi:hypothetical protein
MPDTLRIVTFSAGGRPVEVLNLNSAPGTVTAYFRERDGGFQFTPAASNVQYSKRARRYGGARAVGETHDNGSIAWTAYVRGATLLAATQNVEALLQTISDEARGRYVEWAPEGGQSSFMEIAGPGTWSPAYNPVEFVQTNAMRVQLTFPILPLVRWARPAIQDPFDIDTRADYTFDSATSADVAASGGVLTPVVGAALTVERRARHTSRGYTWKEGQGTVEFITGTVSGIKVGTMLRATAATTYVEVYIDDNGTNSRLRIDVVIAGTRTNRATINLATRMGNVENHAVRGRIEGNVVIAEHFAGFNTVTPMGAPTNTTSYTLVSGDAPLNTTAGASGWSWIPVNLSATLLTYTFTPYTWRNVTWPRVLQPVDAIPGTAPALADVSLTTSGGSTAPAFAYLAWTPRALTPAAGFAPFAIAVTGLGSPPTGTVYGLTSSSNLTATADAGSLAGVALIDTTVSGAETYVASFTVDPSALVADDFTAGELTLEVFARLLIRSLVVPTGAIYRVYRLGTITLPADPLVRRALLLTLTAKTAAGSTGEFRLDYIQVAPASSRALSPTGKPLDAAYPIFIASTSQTIKTIASDLSATVSQPGNAASGDHGLGGSLIEPNPGLFDMLVKLSNVVPDDPAPAATADQLQNSAALQVAVTPRSYMLRSS